MMGSDSMDVSIEALWRCWKRFRTGKKRTTEFERFAYNLEEHLFSLQRDLADGTYRHGSYRTFEVRDPKRRMIAVASVRDRLVHRLLYDELVRLYDHIFLYDVWSCRKEKGLHGALDRAQNFLHAFPRGWVWRADIHKFFDHMDHAVLLQLLQRKIEDERMFSVLQEVIGSYEVESTGKWGGGRVGIARAASPSAMSRAKSSRISTCTSSIGLLCTHCGRAGTCGMGMTSSLSDGVFVSLQGSKTLPRRSSNMR